MPDGFFFIIRRNAGRQAGQAVDSSKCSLDPRRSEMMEKEMMLPVPPLTTEDLTQVATSEIIAVTSVAPTLLRITGTGAPPQQNLQTLCESGRASRRIGWFGGIHAIPRIALGRVRASRLIRCS